MTFYFWINRSKILWGQQLKFLVLNVLWSVARDTMDSGFFQWPGISVFSWDLPKIGSYTCRSNCRSPQCDICDANDAQHRHPIEFAIDGTRRWVNSGCFWNPNGCCDLWIWINRYYRWWQSPSLANGLQYERVNITLDLRQVIRVFPSFFRWHFFFSFSSIYALSLEPLHYRKSILTLGLYSVWLWLRHTSDIKEVCQGTYMH